MRGLAEVLALLAAGAALVLALVRIVHLLHMLQLEEYDTQRFVHWVVLHIDQLAANPMVDLLGLLGVVVLFLPLETVLSEGVIVCSLSIAVGLAGLLWERRLGARSPVKKALVMTPRARRLLGCAAILSVGTCLVLLAGWERLGLGIAWLLPMLAPAVLVVSRTIMEPIEASIRDWYIRDARRTLAGYAPIVVGITGSYGKTSTKFFTAHLLESRYRVLMTPESYNTAMGICRVIRGQLGPEHEVLVVELAENEKGGFEHLLCLVPCSISIVTSVGLQHLEEFGSKAAIGRVMKGFVSMPESGSTVVLNADDPVLAEIGSVQGKRILRASAGGSLSSDLYAENIVMSADGLSFDIVMSQDERFACCTKLLGWHNVENILLAVAVARELGVSWNAIQDSVSTLQAPPHRLQVMAGAGGVRIIDDAFNSNPAGFAMAMEVLAAFPSRRVLVTPGLVSLGKVEDAANIEAGRRAAGAADTVILVGPKKTRLVREGLLSAGFPETNILTACSLEEVTGLMRSLLKPGDTVMFENDLPDTYNE
jgi:UDP-N-acetylmuramoyl-tripeptide--D-alanyl-D-alanine ligase